MKIMTNCNKNATLRYVMQNNLSRSVTGSDATGGTQAAFIN